jgi:hypothetical protein
LCNVIAEEAEEGFATASLNHAQQEYYAQPRMLRSAKNVENVRKILVSETLRQFGHRKVYHMAVSLTKVPSAIIFQEKSPVVI